MGERISECSLLFSCSYSFTVKDPSVFVCAFYLWACILKDNLSKPVQGDHNAYSDTPSHTISVSDLIHDKSRAEKDLFVQKIKHPVNIFDAQQAIAAFMNSY